MTDLYDTNGNRASTAISQPSGNAWTMTRTWRLIEDAALRRNVLREYAQEHLPHAKPGSDLPDPAELFASAERLAGHLGKIERAVSDLRDELVLGDPLDEQLTELWDRGRFGDPTGMDIPPKT